MADQFGAEQHDQPAQVDPQQEQRYRGKGAIDQLVGGEQADIQGEQRLGGLEQQGTEAAAEQCMATGHLGIGHGGIQQGEGGDAGQQRHQPEQGRRPR
ncbi:hypothetical protein D3C78_1183490 [compost metagenome]